MIREEVLREAGIHEGKLLNALIFDLGNVLIDIRLDRTFEAFRQLGLKQFDELYTFEKQIPLFTDYETGRISTEQFRQGLRSFLSDGIADESIDRAWLAMLGELPAEHVRLLQRLQRRYSLYLLSNTNEMHVRYFTSQAGAKYGEGIFNRLFVKTYYSNEIHLRKPDPEVYEFVVKDAGLKKSSLLFIDDSMVNVEGARRAGLPAYCLKEKNLLSLFSF